MTESSALVDGKYSIKDLVDIEALRNVFEKFSHATGFTVGLVSYPEQEVLLKTGWRDICAKFHRACPESARYCKKSNAYLTEQSKEFGHLNIRPCENGLVDGATPIVISGVHVASLFSGQVLFEKPDIDRFKKQAEIYGFNSDEYLDALNNVPIITEDKLKKVLFFLSAIATMIAEQGASRLKIQKSERALQEEQNERRQVVETLRESEEKFRNLFNLSPQPVALSNLKTGKVIDVNDRFCELTKYTREEVLGRTRRDVGYRSEEDRDRFLKELKKSGSVEGFEFSFMRKDGTMIETIMFSRLIKVADGDCILTVFYDQTEKRRLEAQLQQAQKMESIGTLAGGIAHDFNNLLMGIQGRASLMMVNTDSSHQHFEHLKGIEEYVRNAADLTKQLLGFARGGKYEVKPANMNELIKNQNQMFGRTNKEITILEKWEKDVWTVEIDHGQIKQVLLNLYVNAWQAMPGGGDLYVQTENTTINGGYGKSYLVESGRYVKITITDTGSGMDEPTRQRIFDPFFTTKEMGRGTGLGLATVYGIIKNHGGFIDVESKKGEGSTFTIYLPASEVEIEERKGLSGKVLKGKETVLFVDDEEMIVDVGEQLLKTLGYNVIIARSGNEAIEIFRENEDCIDIIILDMIMPGMGGGETYDLLKKIDPAVKVLLSSGFSINGQATEILNRGCNSFIQKPFGMNKLSQKLREVLDED